MQTVDCCNPFCLLLSPIKWVHTGVHEPWRSGQLHKTLLSNFFIAMTILGQAAHFEAMHVLNVIVLTYMWLHVYDPYTYGLSVWVATVVSGTQREVGAPSAAHVLLVHTVNCLLHCSEMPHMCFCWSTSRWMSHKPMCTCILTFCQTMAVRSILVCTESEYMATMCSRRTPTTSWLLLSCIVTCLCPVLLEQLLST